MWKSRCLFAVIFISALAFAVTYKDPSIGLSVIYALFFMFVFSLISIVLSFFLVSFEQSVSSDSLIKKEKLIYTANIKNKSICFYTNIKKQYYNEDMFEYALLEPNRKYLNARSTAINKYELTFPYRGVYEIGIKKVTISDFLGLFSISFKMKSPRYITVFPAYNKDTQTAVFGQNTSAGVKVFDEDYSSVAEIRKYSSSDSLKRIHWKLSSKRGELMVKNFNYFERDRAVLFLDTCFIPLEKISRLKFEDTVISYVAGSIDHCAKGNVPCTLIYGDDNGQQMNINEGYDTDKVFRLLAEVKFDSDNTEFDYMKFLSNSHTYILFLSGVNRSIYKSILSIASSENTVTLFYFYSESIPYQDDVDEFLDILALSGVVVNKIKVG